MASVASQLIEEVTAHSQSDSLEDAREICADGTYCPNSLVQYHRKNIQQVTIKSNCRNKITERFHSFSHKHDAVHTTRGAAWGDGRGGGGRGAATPGARFPGDGKMNILN